MRPLLIALSLLLLLLHSSSNAELRWAQPIQAFQRTPEDHELTATYSFQNVGNSPVTVRSIKTSCGCTTARLEKKTYAPGESGDLKAHFVFGGRKGIQRKLITVKTDDEAEPTILDLRVVVDDPVTVTPAFVYWKVGEPNAPKIVRVTTRNPEISLKGLVSGNPDWSGEIETIKPREEFLVRIKPRDTSAKSGAEIKIVTDFPPDQPRSYVVHGRVK